MRCSLHRIASDYTISCRGQQMTKAKPKLTRFQTFTPMRVLRSQMAFMPGNPQTMTEAQAKALSEALDVDGDGVGLLQTIVWNKSTGHIVGGNHRVLEIDAHEGYDAVTHANDYSIDVAAIDVPEARERAIVLALNNPRLTGQPEVDALRAFLGTVPEDDLAKTGFTAADCSYLLGSDADRAEVMNKELSVGEVLWGPNFQQRKQVVEIVEDEVPEVPKVPVTQPGDLWLLGAFWSCEDCGTEYSYEDGKLMNGVCPCVPQLAGAA